MDFGLPELMVLIEEVVEEQETELSKKLRQKRNRLKPRGRKEYPSNKYNYRGPKQRHIDTFGRGSWDLLALGRGIVEEDALIDREDQQLKGFEELFHELGYDEQVEIEEEKEKKKRAACLAGNPYHDKKGKFVNPYKAPGSWSIAADDRNKRKAKSTNCDRGQMRRANSNRSMTMVKTGACGRKSRKKGDYIRCYDNRRAVPEGVGSVGVPTSEDGSVDLYQVSKALKSKKDRIEKLETAVRQLLKRKDCKSLSIDNAVKMIRNIVLSTKGKFPDKPQDK